ncbi:tripartite-type tricarboxylate transporter receptor subunit TctC [Beijerinckia sp. GAS462]|nr:tripartite-type tricarboxylate transporter receptor subunit TctC [Beijerinckia sp. GAS462]SEC32884.1 Tripartite-type tricarboxylate transporter, receptor component TctC [Beijerinckia sp. 28-YEA-48]
MAAIAHGRLVGFWTGRARAEIKQIVRLWRGAVLAFLMLGGVTASAEAQSAATDYPNRPIRLIVPFAAGGGNDIFARVVGAKASTIMGQQLIIENRPAAGGRMAAEYVATQPADGYTLFVGASGNMSMAAAVYPNLAYHPTKSFEPLTTIASFPLVLVVPSTSPIKSIADLVAYAKNNPDKATYGTSSPAFTMTVELLKLETGMPGVALPLKSTAEMVQCVNQELCLLAIADPPPTVEQVKDGRVRALAVTGPQRAPELPDVPTTAEAGVPRVNTMLWSGLLTPAGTPPAIVKKLVAVFQQAVRDPEVSSRLRMLGAEPGAISPEEFRKVIEADIAGFSHIVKAANLTFQ